VTTRFPKVSRPGQYPMTITVSWGPDRILTVPNTLTAGTPTQRWLTGIAQEVAGWSPSFKKFDKILDFGPNPPENAELVDRLLSGQTLARKYADREYLRWLDRNPTSINCS
jgi:hypothetical protein